VRRYALVADGLYDSILARTVTADKPASGTQAP